ncbi:hypothetical protein [Luteibaculum oceani]|uniref:Uncharacterized protein n=1 Tax=Luteibaculum oceani TaxID=1294296 RepID=A0A5C6V9D6_9FLAO|nr:hypothetical protein [Luteibaculum oceani]TXC81330.1 hypothetical protein FRX97_04825 [Luteibaculum oceani]
MATLKYIRTKEGEIIAFPEYKCHAEYAHLNPISAGFIEMYHDESGHLRFRCFGESVSLKIVSKEREDTELLNKKIVKKELYSFF